MTNAVSAAPPIPGLVVRRARMPDDAAALAALANRAAVADELDDRDSADEWVQWFATASGWDPALDVLIGELAGRVVVYSQVRRKVDNDGGLDYTTEALVDPDVRRRGIGRAMLHLAEARIAEIAAGDPTDVPRRIEGWAYESQPGAIALLESEGFSIARYFFEMLRPSLEEIPDMPLPEGLEIRPLRPERWRAVWSADVEAFRDHWGGMDQSDAAFERHFSGPNFTPELWRVAWDGDEVAGVVMNEVMAPFNAATGAQRGLLAAVSVRRPWRGRGLARALVADSLRALRTAGMTSATLGVDAQNPTGALGVYEACGFLVSKRGRDYRKPVAAVSGRPRRAPAAGPRGSSRSPAR